VKIKFGHDEEQFTQGRVPCHAKQWPTPPSIFNVTDPVGGFLPGVLQVRLDDSSLELQVKLDEEFSQLVECGRLLRDLIFPRSDSK
jgi:hypothetical protein